MIATLLLISAAAAAEAPATPAKAQLPTDRVECRMIQETSSRIPIRVCRLSQEWELLAKDAQDDLRSSRNQRSVVNN
jgi:hypothetical protein